MKNPDHKPLTKAQAEQISLLYRLDARTEATAVNQRSPGGRGLSPILIGSSLAARDFVRSAPREADGGRRVYWLTDKGARIASRIVNAADQRGVA